LGCASRGSEVSCRPCSNCRCSTPCAVETRSTSRSTRAIQNLVVKDGHPNLVGLPSPVPSRISTVSRRFHPVALTRAGARSAEAVERRTRDTPSRSTERTVPVALGLRLESSRPPCGETERRPSSGAPSTDAPRVDGLCQSFRSTRTHASAQRLVQSSRPTDTLGALLAPTRLRDLAAPLLTPVRVRNDSFRCRRQMG